jgi:hypothetical protein
MNAYREMYMILGGMAESRANFLVSPVVSTIAQYSLDNTTFCCVLRCIRAGRAAKPYSQTKICVLLVCIFR